MKRLALCTCVAALFACSALAKTPSDPTTMQLVCKDGTQITVETTKGACSGHGGIDKNASKDQAATSKSSSAGGKSSSTRTLGAGPEKVWANDSTKVYHCSGDRYYGKTKNGEYMSEADAKSKGFRPDHGKA